MPGDGEGDSYCLAAARVFYFVAREGGVCGGDVGLDGFDAETSGIVGEAGGLAADDDAL